MDFSNYGTLWQLDHIKPVSLCRYKEIYDLIDCFTFYNIMPLYTKENIHKSNKRDFDLEYHRETILKLFYSDINKWFLNPTETIPRLYDRLDNIPLSKLQGPHSLIVDFCNSHL